MKSVVYEYIISSIAFHKSHLRSGDTLLLNQSHIIVAHITVVIRQYFLGKLIAVIYFNIYSIFAAIVRHIYACCGTIGAYPTIYYKLIVIEATNLNNAKYTIIIFYNNINQIKIIIL